MQDLGRGRFDDDVYFGLAGVAGLLLIGGAVLARRATSCGRRIGAGRRRRGRRDAAVLRAVQ
ncbi:MAG: hypothetical protein ACRDQF_13390 [Thermocrispum sp.]